MQFNVVTIGVLTMFIMLLACGEVEQPVKNKSPVIDVVLVPARVEANSRVQVIALAHDVDGDTISYKWMVDGGTLVTTNTWAVWWNVPAVEAVYRVTVHVTDNINSSVPLTTLVSVEEKAEPSSTITPPPQYVPSVVSNPPPMPPPVPEPEKVDNTRIPCSRFKNCTELKRVYPRGVSTAKLSCATDRNKLDRDDDGWACE